MWVEALRSGEYEQGEGFLHEASSGEWCCLGVLCDLAINSGVDLSVGENEGEHHTVTQFGDKTQTLPREVVHWAELISDNPTVEWTTDEDHAEENSWLIDDDRGRCQSDLAQLNDSGLTFERIAQIIEQGIFI